MSKQTQETGGAPKWSGSFGFIMAAAGSAVGMGNLWRFPMLVGESGGGAFVLVYLICIFLVGIPLIIAEISIGRAGGKDAFGSYKALNSKWGGVGILAVITSFIGLSYYAVLGGWVLRYIFVSVTGLPKSSEEFFVSFTSSTGSQIDLQVLHEKVREKSAFPDEQDFIFLSESAKDSVPVGAALGFVKEFLEEI